MAGVPLEYVSAWLGHCSVYVTRRAYAKLQLLKLHEYTDAIDKAFDACDNANSPQLESAEDL
jgi:hypothetical protein